MSCAVGWRRMHGRLTSAKPFLWRHQPVGEPMQQTATLVACSRSMSLAMASHCVMAVRFGTIVLCEFVVCGGVLPFVLPPLLLQAQLQVFHSVSNSAMLLCRGLLCAVHFPPYFFSVYRYVFLQCSGFRLPTPTSPTSVRGGCVCVSFSVGFLCLASSLVATAAERLCALLCLSVAVFAVPCSNFRPLCVFEELAEIFVEASSVPNEKIYIYRYFFFRYRSL